MDEDRAKQRLNETLAQLDDTAGRVRENNDEFRDQPEYESGRLSQHPGEYGTDVQNRNEQELFLGEAEQERERVHEAFARLDNGTYGSCVNCGRQIGEERLEVRPHAARCVDCEEKAERQAAPQ
jgi:DnaK suppressor protein